MALNLKWIVSSQTRFVDSGYKYYLRSSSNIKRRIPNYMRWLLFLSRLAFICNIFFLFAFSIQISHWIKNQDLTDYIITIGFVMAFILNPVVNLCYLFTGIVSKKKLAIVPVWLIVANVLFLIIDAFYLLYINAHQ